MEEKRSRLNIAGAGLAALAVLAAVGIAAEPAFAACVNTTEVSVDAVFKGSKCTTWKSVTYQGTYAYLKDGETLTGTLRKITKNGESSVTKQGNVQGKNFTGSLTSDAQHLAGGVVNSNETREGTEQLDPEGTFSGTSRVARRGDELYTNKYGRIESKAFTGSLTSDAQHLAGGVVNANIVMEGTWPIKNRTFVGTLRISQRGSEVFVDDRRTEQ